MALIWNPQSELLREPKLLVPHKKPIGPVKVDWSNSITSSYIDGWANTFSGEARKSLAGREYGWLRSVSSAEISRKVTGDRVSHTCITTSTSNGACPYIDLGSDKASGKTVTILTEIEVFNSAELASDHGLLLFSNDNTASATSWGAFSWMDKLASVLRTAVYTKYDTTNTIASVGRYIVGFSVDVSGNYQTYFNGLPSQSGSTTRQATHRYMAIGAGKGTPLIKGGSTSGLGITMYWAHVWFRDLSDGEVWSVSNDPYQFLIPA